MHVCVLKRYNLSEAESLPTLKKELRALASLGHHPNIVSPNLFFVEDGSNESPAAAYIELPFYDQGDMERWLSTDPSEDAVFFALSDALRGLDCMHSRGFIHCDVRGRNILVRRQPDGAGWEAALSDFDISIDSTARASRSTVSQAFRGFEGILTMAPEVRNGQAACSTASDCYSFGGLVFASIFRNVEPTVDPLTQTVHIPPHRDPDVPRLLSALLSPTRELRPSAAQALAHPAFAAPGQRMREEALREAVEVDSRLAILEGERDALRGESSEQRRVLKEEGVQIERERERLVRRAQKCVEESAGRRKAVEEESAEVQKQLRKVVADKARLSAREKALVEEQGAKQRELDRKGKALREEEAKVLILLLERLR